MDDSQFNGYSTVEMFIVGGLEAMKNVSMVRSINLELPNAIQHRIGLKTWTHLLIDRIVELHQPLVIKHEQLIEQHKVLQAEYEALGGEVFKGE